MFAEKISGYSEAKSALDKSSAIVAEKLAEVAELDSNITDTTEKLTAIQEQLNAAPVQMAKNELSTEEFIRLRYDADALQAMLQGLTEVRTAQKTALSSLSQEKDRLESQLNTMVRKYAEQRADKFVNDALLSAKEPLKFLVSSVIAGENFDTDSDVIYRRVGLKLFKMLYEEEHKRLAAFIPNQHDARRYMESVKQSLLTEV